jgi:ceramide glucosyltransferase
MLAFRFENIIAIAWPPSWRTLVCLVALLPLAYYLVATLATVRFFRRERRKELGAFAPPISVLKPVRGVDFASYENFKSFCLQDYPEYEILFCVNDLKDAAVQLIHRLKEEFPQRELRLLSDAPQLGSNRKVNNLALLAREARYELLVQSDGDVRVGPAYLREMAAPFQGTETGAVSCLYRGTTQDSLWAEIEALGAATDFSAGVLVADWNEDVPFALGASVATTKNWLEKIGGYEALSNMLADDYEIGNRIARAGGRVMVSREVVETMYPAMTFSEFWEHQLRWARTVRLCRPASYLGLLVTHGLPWALVGAAASGSARAAAFLFTAYFVLRLALAWTIGVWGMKDETARKRWWLVPLRDALHFGVWVGSFFSKRIVWGGTEFQLKSNGDMVSLGATGAKKREPEEVRAG